MRFLPLFVDLSSGLVAVVGGRGMAADQAPAMRTAQINMRDVQRAVWAGVVTHKEQFGEVVDGHHRALPVGDRLGLAV